MNDELDFIREHDDSPPVRSGDLTGWETVVFEIGDDCEASE